MKTMTIHIYPKQVYAIYEATGREPMRLYFANGDRLIRHVARNCEIGWNIKIVNHLKNTSKKKK